MDSHMGTILVLIVAMGLSPPPPFALKTSAAPRGVIGLDTSHATAFAKLFNDPKSTGDIAGCEDRGRLSRRQRGHPSSRDRIADFTKQYSGHEHRDRRFDSERCWKRWTSCCWRASMAGRTSSRRRPVFKAGKPVFIDKPLAGSLADAIAIDELAKK